MPLAEIFEHFLNIYLFINTQRLPGAEKITFLQPRLYMTDHAGPRWYECNPGTKKPFEVT